MTTSNNRKFWISMIGASNGFFIPLVLLADEFLPSFRNRIFMAAATAYILLIVVSGIVRTMQLVDSKPTGERREE